MERRVFKKVSGAKVMLYSNDEKQIRELLAAKIADNVKKGWEEV